MPKNKKSAGGRRLSPYNKFMRTELARVKHEHPELAHRDVFKQAANNWKNSPNNPKNGPQRQEVYHSTDRSSSSAEPPRAAISTSRHYEPSHTMTEREKEHHIGDEGESMPQKSHEPTPSTMIQTSTAQSKDTSLAGGAPSTEPAMHSSNMDMPTMSFATGGVDGGSAGINSSTNGSDMMSRAQQHHPSSSSDTNHKKHEHSREPLMQSSMPINSDMGITNAYNFQNTHNWGF